MPVRQATVETAVCCVAGHIYLVVQQLFERKAARAHVQLHAGGAVASCVGPSVAHVAVAAAAVEGSFAAVIFACRLKTQQNRPAICTHPIAAHVLRDLCAGSLIHLSCDAAGDLA